jgi:glucose/arabinose dehydrogenase
MRRRLTCPVACALFVVCLLGLLPSAASARIVARRVVGGLEQAVAFTFDHRGRIWYVQKAAGDIHVVDPETGRGWRFFDVPNVSSDGEQGLLGIALHPAFPQEPFVYVFATRSVEGRLVDQILRIRSERGHGHGFRAIYSSRAGSGHIHSGGRILFGPDGMLYAVVGDASASSNAQDLSTTRGKILRMTPLGDVPDDNPFGSRVFAYGIRNSFGFAFDPRTDRMWETENGPECTDELNRIRAGGNFGWGPSQSCSGTAPQGTNQDGDDPILPAYWYTPTIAPTGIAFCERCGLGPRSDGTMLFAALNTGDLRRVELSDDRLRPIGQGVVFHSPKLLLSLEPGPGGRLYVCTFTAIFRLERAPSVHRWRR